jgi:hypothetical protein
MNRVMDCGRRAFNTGLRFAGLSEERDIPVPLESDYLRDVLCKKYGLTCIQNGHVDTGNRPVLIVYKNGEVSTGEEEHHEIFHAVFMSDIQPLVDTTSHTVVLGWENLNHEN